MSIQTERHNGSVYSYTCPKCGTDHFTWKSLKACIKIDEERENKSKQQLLVKI